MCIRDRYDTGHLYDRLQVLEREEMPLGRRERLSAVERPLLAWYSSRARSLPWRDDPKPYRVWISEIKMCIRDRLYTQIRICPVQDLPSGNPGI